MASVLWEQRFLILTMKANVTGNRDKEPRKTIWRTQKTKAVYDSRDGVTKNTVHAVSKRTWRQHILMTFWDVRLRKLHRTRQTEVPVTDRSKRI